jgi:hypothetical protein
MNRFGDTAKGLAQNPLGIIALFIVLVYGFASLVVGVGTNLDNTSTNVLVWFMVLFPVLVLIVFAWLVSQHHMKLYSPRDYGKGEFLQIVQQVHPGLQNLPRVSSSTSLRSVVVRGEDLPGEDLRGEDPPGAFHGEGAERSSTFNAATHLGAVAEWITTRDDIYERFRHIFIVHVLAPSTQEGQDYDIFIYLRRHNDKPITDVTKAEFFSGGSGGMKSLKASARVM